MRVAAVVALAVLLGGCVLPSQGLNDARGDALSGIGSLLPTGTRITYTSDAGAASWDAIAAITVPAQVGLTETPATLLVPAAGSLEDSVAAGAALQSLGPWRQGLLVPDPVCSDGPCDATLHSYMQAAAAPPRSLHLPPPSLRVGSSTGHSVAFEGVSQWALVLWADEGVRTLLVVEVVDQEDGADPWGRKTRLAVLEAHLVVRTEACAILLVFAGCEHQDPVPINETVADPIRLRYDPRSGLFMDGHIPGWASAMPEWWFLPPDTRGPFRLASVGEAPTMTLADIARTLNERLVQDLLAIHGPLGAEAPGARLTGGLDGDPAPVQVNLTYWHGELPPGAGPDLVVVATDPDGAGLDLAPTSSGATASVQHPMAVQWDVRSRIFGRDAGSVSLHTAVGYDGQATVPCRMAAGIPAGCPSLLFPVPSAGSLEATLTLPADVPLDAVRILNAEGAVLLEEEPGAAWNGSMHVTARDGVLWELAWDPPVGAGDVRYQVRVEPAVPAASDTTG